VSDFDDYAGWRPQPLPQGWELLSSERRDQVAAELVAELSEGHVLHGKRLFAVARCVACDHTLVRTADEEWAIVHVTYRGSTEPPPWPSTTVFDARLPREALAAHAH
jgi:hypothetical protein